MRESTPTNTVSDMYFAGLFDSRATISLNPTKHDSTSVGYRFSPSIDISGHNSMHTGLIAEFLQSHEISHSIDGGTSVEISSRSAIESLDEFLRGKIVSKSKQLAFVAESYFQLLDEGTVHSPRGMVAVSRGFEEITPRWQGYKNRKYTAEFFASEMGNRFDIKPTELDPISPPDIDYPAPPSVEYFTGFIDSAGRFRLDVSESNMYDIGYNIHPILTLSERWIGPRLTAYLEEFLDQLGVMYSVDDDFYHIYITVTQIDSIETLIEEIGTGLFIQYPQAEFLYEQGIPAFRDGYHLTKQGLYELLSVFEEFPTSRVSSSRKYTANYFEELWGDDLEFLRE